MNCSGLLLSVTLLHTYTLRAECYPSSCVSVCTWCVPMLLGYCNWPGDSWLLSSLPLPVTPSAHLLTHAGGLTSSSDDFLSSLSPLSSAYSQFFQLSYDKNDCLLINTSRGHWISSVNGSTVCQPLALLSLSLCVTAHSVCGLGELWSPVTPWISGSVVGGWLILFC